MNLIKLILLYFPEIASLCIFTLILFINFKSKVSIILKNWRSGLLFCIFLGVACYLTLSLIGSIWIEKPRDHSYAFQDGKWIQFKKRILHTPFGFNGYHLLPNDFEDSFNWSLTGQSGLRIYYHIEEANIKPILYKIGTSYSADLKNMCLTDVCYPVLSKLVYSMSKEDIVNRERRIQMFKAALDPLGVTVDKVDFIYLYTPGKSSNDS